MKSDVPTTTHTFLPVLLGLYNLDTELEKFKVKYDVVHIKDSFTTGGFGDDSQFYIFDDTDPCSSDRSPVREMLWRICKFALYCKYYELYKPPRGRGVIFVSHTPL